MLFKWFFFSFSFNIKLVFFEYLYEILNNILAYLLAIKIIIIYAIMFSEFSNNVQTVRQSKTGKVDCKESRCILYSTAVAPRWVPSDEQILQTAASFICGKSAAPDPRRHLIGGDDPLIKRNLDLC